jgi:hypothetical protein
VEIGLDSSRPNVTTRHCHEGDNPFSFLTLISRLQVHSFVSLSSFFCSSAYACLTPDNQMRGRAGMYSGATPQYRQWQGEARGAKYDKSHMVVSTKKTPEF